MAKDGGESTRSYRPLRAVFLDFLERVLHIEAAQRERGLAIDPRMAAFLEDGLLPEDGYCWSTRGNQIIKALYYSAAGVIPQRSRMVPVVNAVVVAWRQFLDEWRHSKWVTVATDPATGIRHELTPSDLVSDQPQWIDVLNSALLELHQGDRQVRWTAIEIWEADAPRTEFSEADALRQTVGLPAKRPVGVGIGPMPWRAVHEMIAMAREGIDWANLEDLFAKLRERPGLRTISKRSRDTACACLRRYGLPTDAVGLREFAKILR